jgi:peptide/nickel transport system permease protein
MRVENSESIDSIQKGMSPWAIAKKKFKKSKLALFGLAIITILIIISFAAPLITPYERDVLDTSNAYQAPSKEHWLGTDDIGRDTFTRLVYGTRVSLSVGLVSTSIAVIIGVSLGALGGYYGGALDLIIMRIVDMFMCFPFFLIAIVMAAIMGPSIWNIMIISGLLSWTRIARIVRAEVLSIKEREFVEASKALGLNTPKIVIKHIIPNILAPVIVYATLGIAQGILSEAGLSYLGLGVKQPVPSWGNMLAAAQSLRSLNLHWWLWVPPGVMVLLTVLSINFLGDGLRDALDPKTD